MADPHSRFILVVVEDDADGSRAKLVTAMERRLRGVAVRGTGNPDEAMRLVADPDCALLVTVEEGRTIDGLVLAACGRQQQRTLPIVLLADPRATASPAFDRASVERLSIPVPLSLLLEHVERLLEPAAGFRGEVTAPTFLELVRLLAAAHVSGVLSVRQRDLTGTIWLELGSVVHVVFDGYVGIEAFHRMLRWRGGSFSFTPGQAPARTIVMAGEQLLAECARFLDTERSLARGSSPGLHIAAAAHFSRGLDLLRRGKHDEAIAELQQAAHLDLENATYREHLARVRRLRPRRSG